MYVNTPARTLQRPLPGIEQAHAAASRATLTCASAGAGVSDTLSAVGRPCASNIPQIPLHCLGAAPAPAPALSTLIAVPSLSALPGATIRANLASQTLRPFSVDSITSDEAEAFQAFADNRSLKTLAVGIVTQANSLVTLSRSTTLTSVYLHLNGSARAGIPHLANLPALDALAITGLNIRLTPTDVQALCAKPLSSLGFNFMRIDSAVLEMIVQAQSASLSLMYTSALNDTMVDGLVANERISALRVVGGVVDERRALRLIASPTLQKLTVDFDSDVPDIAEAYFTRTWIAAGKSLGNLSLSVLPIVEDDA